MAQASNEQFLFSCIENSNGGTVNWEKVAGECGIVTKGAAQIRKIKYHRLKKKFGVATNEATSQMRESPGPAESEQEATPIKKKKKSPAKRSPTKERKSDEDGDDAEGANIKAEERDDA